MEQYFDYHTHTVYSHGTGNILQNASRAKEIGLSGIAITDHGFSHPFYGVKRKDLAQMKFECENAQNSLNISVKLGVESNILGESGKCDVSASDYDSLDIFCAGVHRMVLYETPNDYVNLFGETYLRAKLKIEPPKWLVDYTTRVYVNAIKNNPLDFVTHVGYLCFCDAETVAKCCQDYGTLFEINTKKSHLSLNDWEKVLKTEVKFIVNSDAHSPVRVGDVDLFNQLDNVLHFPRQRIVNFSKDLPKFRFSEFKERL